jgi:SNF2 family DNA or RNA helicase
MLVLHAAFCQSELLLWCEPERGGEPLQLAIGALGIRSRLSSAELATKIVWLPAKGGQPLASHVALLELPIEDSDCHLFPLPVTAAALPEEDLLSLLAAAAGRRIAAPGLLLGPDLRYWAEAMHYAMNLVARGQYLPSLIIHGNEYHARWTPVFSGPDAARLHRLAKAMPAAARAMTLEPIAPPDGAAETVLTGFLSAMVDTLVRYSPAATGGEPPADTLHQRWLRALNSTDSRVVGDGRELKTFAQQIADWRRPVQISSEAPFRLCFRLEEPQQDGDLWQVRYLLQGARDPSLFIPAGQIWSPNRKEMRALGADPAKLRELLLLSLGQAAPLCAPAEESLNCAAPEGFALDTAGAHAFLRSTAELLEQSGFGVLLPNWWQTRRSGVRLQARGVVKTPAKLRAASALSLQTLLDFQWELALGDEPITKKELLALARQKSPLVKLRGQWVEVNAAEIADAVRFLEQGTTKATAGELLRMAIGASGQTERFDIAGIKASGWLKDLLSQIESRTPPVELPQPAELRGELRPYQLRGFSWMAALKRLGLGACLADDMGLGKTIQTLALIQHDVRAGETRPVLLVCPTSVVGNWQKEAARFTPELGVLVHHGAARKKDATFAKEATRRQIVLCSYALLHRDLHLLRGVEWAGVILDEAQNIKNAETRQSQAARALSAGYRVALTGTPVENNVGDLWSIMEFLNPGLLGSYAAFKKRFFVPIQVYGDQEASARLKRITGPFVLRREKTDKSIIADLPDKLEMKVFCNLTREQASLYQAVAEESQAAIEAAEGITRRGLVLATILKLKQICNHPAQFLQDHSPAGNRSGKLARLTEMLEETLEVGDRCLLFTQFAEMGRLLQTHLCGTFGIEVLYLHGGSSRKQRDEMVARFADPQGPRLFVLSLKAGGTGLNLTSANHVFHFDRWWNPAVENQATDRAFRIGQKRNVQVHKFICTGTLEERIDEMIERKKEIAGKIIGAGETWISELSNKELRSLFALGKDAVAE